VPEKLKQVEMIIFSRKKKYGSDYNAAAICSTDGRHLAIMPHPERALRPWNCAHYPADRQHDEFTPWMEIFVNAANWIKSNR